MYDDLPAFSAASLLRRNRWLIRLRWYAILVMLAGILATGLLPPEQQTAHKLAIILGVLVLSNLIYLYSTHISGIFTKIRLVKLLTTQMFVDLAILTLLIYFTGGIESPLAFFYVFHIIIASVIFPGRLPYLYAGLAVMLYSTMLALENLGLLPHVRFYPGVQVADNIQIVVSTWLIFLTTIFASAYLAKNVTDRHRRVRDELELANAKLQDVNRSKTNFLRLSSHEMKAPIITIQSALMVIRDVLDEGVDERVLDMVDRAIKKTDEMILILQDLAHLTYGNLKEKAEFRLLNICDLLRDAVDGQSADAQRKAVDLKLELQEHDCQYRGDLHALQRVFNNLVSNAVRYTPEGGKVRVRLAVSETGLSVEVTDTGIGIPQEEQTNIFQEFYRTPEARKTIREGTGLGLSIVQRMVELHDGHIELKSETGAGSSFRVVLPRREEQ